MITSTNPIMKILWRWQARSKIKNEDLFIKFSAISILNELGKESDFNLIISYIFYENQIIRNIVVVALKSIYERFKTIEETKISFEKQILSYFERADNLIEKLTVIELLSILDLKIREKYLGELINDAQNDLQYIIIKSLQDTQKLELLDAVLEASETQDIVLRKIALTIWYRGVTNLQFEDALEYCTPRLHLLIRSTYELQSTGELLHKILSYANVEKLPTPKAYPDFIIRYLNQLLAQWEYDPDAYRSMHLIVVPSYFTFEDKDIEEKPYIIL